MNWSQWFSMLLMAVKVVSSTQQCECTIFALGNYTNANGTQCIEDEGVCQVRHGCGEPCDCVISDDCAGEDKKNKSANMGIFVFCSIMLLIVLLPLLYEAKKKCLSQGVYA